MHVRLLPNLIRRQFVNVFYPSRLRLDSRFRLLHHLHQDCMEMVPDFGSNLITRRSIHVDVCEHNYLSSGEFDLC